MIIYVKSEGMLAMIMAMVISKTWQWWQWKPISLLLSDSLPQSSAALRVEPICSCHSDQRVVLPGICFCFYREVLLHQLVRNPQIINFHKNWFFWHFLKSPLESLENAKGGNVCSMYETGGWASKYWNTWQTHNIRKERKHCTNESLFFTIWCLH